MIENNWTKRDWKPEDFEGSGQYIVRHLKPTSNTKAGRLSTFTYKIGYRHTKGLDIGQQRCCLISMSDGWICEGSYTGGYTEKNGVRMSDGTETVFHPWNSKEELCAYLNASEQGYRPITQAELLVLGTERRIRNGY